MKHKRLWWWLTGIAAVLIILTVASLIVASRIDPILRRRSVEVLEKRFNADVQLKSLHVSFFPVVGATGEGLVIRYRGRPDLPPFISIRRFHAQTGLSELLRQPIHIRKIRLEGLQIHVPPKGDRKFSTNSGGGGGNGMKQLQIDQILADGTFLEILPKKQGKLPLDFDLRKLTLHSISGQDPLSFQAVLTNPKPPGDIQTTGKFGPWQADEPSSTPVSGSYQFRHADLSVFKGISGILSSNGAYKGELDRIVVDGTTDTPDFAVGTGGHPVRLTAEFHAIVDGTDGDTLLQPVNAHFLHSTVLCQGGAEGKPGDKGKTIKLDINVKGARLEDMLRLAVKSDKPAMTGALSFKTKFLLPPGDIDVIRKLQLNGAFGIGAARFTDQSVQEKINTLSHKSEGHPKQSDDDNVFANLKGRFVLKGGAMSFSRLTFRVPGAQVSLNGSYGLEDETFDLHGKLRMKAKVSQTMTGWKSVLLKAADPFFKKNGAGAVLPIKITGTRSHPDFGLDFHRKDDKKAR